MKNVAIKGSALYHATGDLYVVTKILLENND